MNGNIVKINQNPDIIQFDFLLYYVIGENLQSVSKIHVQSGKKNVFYS